MADDNFEAKILGSKERLLQEEAGFIDFCKPFRDYRIRKGYQFFCSGFFFFEKKQNFMIFGQKYHLPVLQEGQVGAPTFFFKFDWDKP